MVVAIDILETKDDDANTQNKCDEAEDLWNRSKEGRMVALIRSESHNILVIPFPHKILRESIIKYFVWSWAFHCHSVTKLENIWAHGCQKYTSKLVYSSR